MEPSKIVLVRHGERLDHIQLDWESKQESLQRSESIPDFHGKEKTSTAKLFEYLRIHRPYDPPLTEAGTIQASKLGEHLASQLLAGGHPGDSKKVKVLVLSSPLVRCIQTAQEISKKLSSVTADVIPIHVEYSLQKDLRKFVGDPHPEIKPEDTKKHKFSITSNQWLHDNVSPLVSLVDDVDGQPSWRSLVAEEDYWEHFSHFDEKRKSNRSGMDDLAMKGFSRLIKVLNNSNEAKQQIIVICVSHSHALESWFKATTHFLHPGIGTCMGYASFCDLHSPELPTSVSDCSFVEHDELTNMEANCCHFSLRGPYFQNL